MISNEQNTIAAIATASGPGGVGIVRVSGGDALGIANSICSKDVLAFDDRKLILSKVIDGNEVVDEALFVKMLGPNSFTGEDVVEIQCHGGYVNLGKILRSLLGQGARLAEPGEFTRRALINGKMDLVQAEAILNISNAKTERSLRMAQAHRSGKLSEEYKSIRLSLSKLLAEIEARIDFPEEGIEAAVFEKLCIDTDKTLASIAKLSDSFVLGGKIKDGALVVMTGKTNVGKSSLLNCLAGEERALVSAEHGTTRDLVEAEIVLNGLNVKVVDTAGLRSNPTDLEKAGWELAEKKKNLADLEIRLIGPDEAPPGDQEKTLVVRSKIDLVDDKNALDLGVSSKTGEGVDALKKLIYDHLIEENNFDESMVVTNERHKNLLENAKEFLVTALANIKNSAPFEVVALDLRGAHRMIGEIVGEEIHEDVLDALFGDFCIGK